MLGLARGDFDLVARGLHDRLHQDRRAHLFPKSMELVRRAHGGRRARRDDLRRRPDRAGLDPLRADRRRRRGLRELAAGWATVSGSPFEPAGADVRSLSLVAGPGRRRHPLSGGGLRPQPSPSAPAARTSLRSRLDASVRGRAGTAGRGLMPRRG